MHMSRELSLLTLLNDPCPGYPKDLRIAYEILGRTGSEVYDVRRGVLTRRVHIDPVPVVAPLVFVGSAFYGVTPTGRKAKLDEVSRVLRQIYRIEHRLSDGIAVSIEEQDLLLLKDDMLDLRTGLQNQPTAFKGVTDILQLLVEKEGGMSVRIDSGTDLNQLFGGNPLPGHKLLEVHITCGGCDSERRTQTSEITQSASRLNFITAKNADYLIPVRDENGCGTLAESLIYETNTSAPFISVTKAVYGHLERMDKVMDVTQEMQSLVTGRLLRVDPEKTNLETLFKRDPAIGLRKQLRIDYETFGFRGSVRVREKSDRLSCPVTLGYPDQTPRDDFQDRNSLTG